jgi:hypothetical protein
MLELLYSICVWPFQASIEFFFLLFMNIVGDEAGLSIIFLAFFMNILLMPFYSLQMLPVNSELEHYAQSKKIKKLLISIKPYLFIFFYALLFIASNVYFENVYFENPPTFGKIKDLTNPDGILGFNLFPTLMLIFAIIALIIIPVIKNKKIHLPSAILMILFFIIFITHYKSPATICLFWAVTALFLCLKNCIDSIKHSSTWYRGIIFFVCLALMIMIGFRYKELRLANTLALAAIILTTMLITLFINSIQRFFEGPIFYSAETHSLAVYRYSCITLFLLAGLVIPLLLFSSSPADFASIGTMIFQTICQAASIFFAATFFYWEFSSKLIRRFLTILIPFLVLLFLISCFAFPGDYGNLTSNFTFEEWKGPGRIVDLGRSAAAIFLSAIIVFCIFRFKKIQWLKNSFLIISASFMIISGMNIFSIVTELVSLKDRTIVSEYDSNEKIFTFSKTGENIFVLFLDRATGFSMPDAFELDPKLKNSLDGFTWYPNTITFGDYTITGYPGMIGGYEYRPLDLNKRTNETLSDKVNEAIKILPQIFSDAGYNVMVTDPTYTNLSGTPDPSIFDGMKNVQSKNIKGIFRKRYDATQNLESKSFYNIFNYDITLRFSFFRMFPPITRPVFYQNGKWFKNTGASSYVDLVNLFPNLLYLEDLCNIAQDGKTFNIMMNDTVHREGAHNRNLELVSEPIIFSKEEIDQYGSLDNVKHTYTFSAALSAVGNWCEWLKQQGIYDNTKIIVVSDHGKSFGGAKISSSIAERRNPLLLVKDFNARGDFVVSNDFMTNADMPAIATSSLTKNSFGSVTNPFTGNEISHAQKNERIFIVDGPWQPQYHNKNSFIIDTIWEVKNQNIFDPENWIDLGKPE